MKAIRMHTQGGPELLAYEDAPKRASDGLYSQSGIFLRTGQDTGARYIGAEQNLDLVWRVDRHTTFQVIAAYCEIGPYLRQTPPAGRNATDFSAKMNYKF